MRPDFYDLPPALAAANLASADRSLLVEVLRAAEEITGCPDQAIELVRDYSIPLFDGLTARELVGAGRGPARRLLPAMGVVRL